MRERSIRGEFPNAMASNLASYPSPSSRAQGWLCISGLGLAVGATAIAAAAYGGVEAWSQLTLLLLAGLAVAIVLIQATLGGASVQFIAAMAFVAGYGLIGLVQATPLPSRLVAYLSPTRHATVGELLAETPAWLSLSYNPADTNQSLRLLLLGAAVFASTAISVRSARHAKLLLSGIFLVGVAEAALAIAQQVTEADGIYWGSVSVGGIRSGSFINHSNFSQFLNLTLGAGLGVLLVGISEDRHARRHRLGRMGSASGVFKRHGWLLLGMALQAIAIAASLSRAGLAAMLLAGIVAGVLISRLKTTSKAVWALAAIPLIAFLGLLVLDFDSLYERVDSLNSDSPAADRIELTMATLRVGASHWLTGAGLGAHASVFPAYDTTGALAFAEQADNDYAQLFEEMGVPGFLAVLGFAALLWGVTNRVLSKRGEPIRYAAVGIAYGLIAVATQSLTDFGLRVPAVFCAAACLAGTCVALASPAGLLSPRLDGKRLLGSVTMTVVLAGLWTWAVLGAIAEYRAERWWSIAFGLDERVNRGSDEPQDYLDLIAASERAFEIHPDRPEYGYGLNAFRWRSLEYAAGGANPIALPNGMETARQIADRLLEVRRVCPTYGPASTLEGQIRRAAGDASGLRLIHQGVRLSPNDPVACFASAIERLRAPHETGSDRIAYELLTHAVNLDGKLYLEAATLVVQSREDVGFATTLAGQQPTRLRALADWLEAERESTVDAERIRHLAVVAQQERVDRGVSYPEEVADLAKRLAGVGRHEEAVRYYLQALAVRFHQVDWRIGLVDSLAAQGRYRDAHREAGVALRLKPRYAPALARREELSSLLPDDQPGLEN